MLSVALPAKKAMTPRTTPRTAVAVAVRTIPFGPLVGDAGNTDPVDGPPGAAELPKFALGTELLPKLVPVPWLPDGPKGDWPGGSQEGPPEGELLPKGLVMVMTYLEGVVELIAGRTVT